MYTLEQTIEAKQLTLNCWTFSVNSRLVKGGEKMIVFQRFSAYTDTFIREWQYSDSKEFKRRRQSVGNIESENWCDLECENWCKFCHHTSNSSTHLLFSIAMYVYALLCTPQTPTSQLWDSLMVQWLDHLCLKPMTWINNFLFPFHIPMSVELNHS